MFEVVMFLIENYTNSGLDLVSNKAAVMAELENIGFPKQEIDRALDWLDGLEQVQTAVQSGFDLTKQSFRHYLASERDHLGSEGMGFLCYLEQLKVLDGMTREIVIDRLMALDKQEVDIPRIQWVVLVALFNQPQKKVALSLLQDLVLSDAFGKVH